MNTELKNTITITDAKAQYDECAKRILGQKCILAHILVRTVKEFQDMDPQEAEQYIEGDPYISSVPLDPGFTNAPSAQGKHRIVGLNTENEELYEGLIRFDIIFYVRMRDGVSQIILNIEAQKEDPSGYDILNRAIYYTSRMVSSQKGREFEGSNYNDIKRVYSIWICMNLPFHCMNHIYLMQKELVGSYQWKGNLDLLNIVMIGLAKRIPPQSKAYELHRLLGTLLSQELTVEQKSIILESEYQLPMEGELGKEVNVMCNLGEGIEERAMEKGKEQGQTLTESKFILNMHRKGFTTEQIADIADKTPSEVEQILLQAGITI